MLEDLQLLDNSVKRESEVQILKTHLETLLLLTTERESRDKLRNAGTYYIIRECHLAVKDEDVRDACERLVQVLMRDEEGKKGEQPDHGMKSLNANGAGTTRQALTQNGEDDDSDDEKIVEIF